MQRLLNSFSFISPFFPPSNYSTSTELRASHRVPFYSFFFSSFFRHNLSRVFEARGGFCGAFRRANASTEFKKQAIHTARESVCLCRGRRHGEKARRGGGGERRGRLCTQLKRHPTEKKKKSSPPSEASSLPAPAAATSPPLLRRPHREKPNHSHYTRRPSASTELPITMHVSMCSKQLFRES